MAIDSKLPPGPTKHTSLEDLWKEISPNRTFGGQPDAAGDDGAPAKKGDKGRGVTHKPKVGAASGIDAAHGGAGTRAPGAGDPSHLLPSADPSTIDADLGHETQLAAQDMPIVNRSATVAQDLSMQAVATPLSGAVDTLSDHLASGTLDNATLKADIGAYKDAMTAAGHGADVAAGLKIMVDAAGLPSADQTKVTAAATAEGIDLSAISDATLKSAQAKLNQDLANPATDAGIVDLDVMQVKNLSADGATAAESLTAAAQASSSDGGSNLAALYAAAAKNGVDLTKDSEDKVGSVKNKAATQKMEKADQKARQQAAQQANAAQQVGSSSQQGGGTHNATGGGGGGGGSTGGAGSTGGSGGGANIQAPTYDPTAAASPHGAKENLSSWTQQVYPKGQFNNEQQHYTDGGQNIAYGADGSATITAKNEGNGDWSSARITGSPVGDLPAYLEATLQVPSGQGTWPAFWLVGPGSWPQGGEVDVMETVNGSNQLHTSNHWGADPVGSAGAMPAWSPSDTIGGLDMSQPHRYGVMVTDSGVQFYLDGKKIGDPVTYPPEANFSQIAKEMVPTLNLAMGGTWPGGVPNDLPDQTMKVLGMTRSKTAPDEGGAS